MPTMVTFQARRAALLALLAALTAGCSREQQDWRSAESADTTEAWARFIEQHPDSELAPEARSRIAEIAEARDWQEATSVATVAAYREFLGRHPHGARAEDARIRIEAFSLGSAPRIEPQTPAEAAASRAATGVPALQIATGTVSPPPPPAASVADNGAAGGSSPPVLAVPGEAAQPAPASASAAASAAATPTDVAALPAAAATVAAAPLATEPVADTAAAPAPVASARAEPVSAAGYGVQLGAFGTEAGADREWQRLQGRFGAQLGGLSPHIILTSTGSGQLYRLQVAAAGEAQARAICDSLREQAQPCVPVLPQAR
jgi:SPOR domain